MAKTIYTTLFFLALSFSTECVAAFTTYSIKDLEILEKERSFEEFFAHARDILPSERDRVWSEMVESMSEELIKYKIKHKQFDRKSLDLIEAINEWPTIRKNEFFAGRRDFYFRKYLENCQTKCRQEDILKFWHNSRKSEEMGHFLGQFVSEKFMTLDPWEFYKAATTGPYSEIYCEKQEVKKQVKLRIVDLLSRVESTTLEDPKLRAIANAKCLMVLISDYEKSLFSPSLQERTAAYHFLGLLTSMSQGLKDLFHVFYLLKGPVPGSVFNEAWNTLTELGKNYKRRQKVLRGLKSLDPLPDALFVSPNNKLRDILMDKIVANFPEYLDHYAKTCLNYYKGQKDFPNGNPTIQCRQFFKLSKGKGWILKGLQRDFADLPIN